MPIIGEFEAAVKEADPNREPDQFRLNGHTFTIADDVNIVAMGRFARSAREGADSDDMEGLAALVDTVASLVIPEDETRFLDTCSKHRVDAQLLMKIIQMVLVAQSGRPTELSVDSSTGQSTTGGNSKAVSSYLEQSVPQSSWRDTPFGKRELAEMPEAYEGITSIEEAGRGLLSAV